MKAEIIYHQQNFIISNVKKTYPGEGGKMMSNRNTNLYIGMNSIRNLTT